MLKYSTFAAVAAIAAPLILCGEAHARPMNVREREVYAKCEGPGGYEQSARMAKFYKDLINRLTAQGRGDTANRQLEYLAEIDPLAADLLDDAAESHETVDAFAARAKKACYYTFKSPAPYYTGHSLEVD